MISSGSESDSVEVVAGTSSTLDSGSFEVGSSDEKVSDDGDSSDVELPDTPNESACSVSAIYYSMSCKEISTSINLLFKLLTEHFIPGTGFKSQSLTPSFLILRKLHQNF